LEPPLSPGWALVLIAGLIVANGVFVAGEFSLISVRRGVLERAAEGGDRRATVALGELDRASFMLSGVQFGITASSLVVGFLAEPAIGEVVVRPVTGLLGLADSTSTGLSVGIAFLLSTVLQMLLGELVPKNLALAIPERIALWVAYPITTFGRAFGPVIRFFDTAATWMTERVFRVEVPEDRRGGHSPAELARIIVVSRREGSLPTDQADLLSRAVELGSRHVSEAMVPWTRVEFLTATDHLDDVRAAARRSGHSRFPVVGDTEDDIVGTIHIKDILTTPPDRRHLAIGELVDEALVVPDSDRLRPLLAKMRASKRTFAIVADEYGAVAGIITVEDILEELVGEIEDEFDTAEAPIRRLPDGSYLFDGDVRVDEVARELDTRLPEGSYETIAGLLISAIGDFPAEGTAIARAGWRFTAVEVDGLRIARVSAHPDEARS